jgi:hypothetical protein
MRVSARTKPDGRADPDPVASRALPYSHIDRDERAMLIRAPMAAAARAAPTRAAGRSSPAGKASARCGASAWVAWPAAASRKPAPAWRATAS